jgi:hypothetical protein
MKQDFNKYTKAELISKLNSKLDLNKSKNDSNESKIDLNKLKIELKNELNKSEKNSPTIIDVIIKFKV